MSHDILPAFDYPNISGYQFRLLSFNHIGAQSQLDLSLVAKSMKTGERPAYHAISYVWGDQTVITTIPINGQLRGISKTLVYVLTKLRQRLAESELFWIDALCINQCDEKEKSFQIHAMGPIYTFATTVHLFPGSDDDNTSLTAKEISKLSAQFSESPPPGSLITNTYLNSRGLPSLDEPIWHKLQVFFEAPWFQRLWVVQEAVLAVDLILHLPDSTLSWAQLIELLTRLGNYSLGHFLDGPIEPLQCRTQTSRRSGRIAMLAIEKMRSQYRWHHSLAAVLFAVRTKLCKDPMDRIYAWYWLLPVEMQAEITPRYLITSAIPFWRPFLELNHICLGAWRDLNSIPLACTIDRLSQLPSWCVNVQSDAEIFAYVGDNCRAGGIRSSEIGAHVATSRDGLQLHLQGIQIGYIAKKFEPRWLACHSVSPHSECATVWILWFTEALKFAQMNTISVENLLWTCTLDDLRGLEGRPLVLTDLQDHYKALVEYWCQCAKNLDIGALNPSAPEVLQIGLTSNAFTKAMQGRRLYITDMGKVCLAHHAADVGDVLCVFEGASAVFALRSKQPQCQGQQITHSFVSDAWVHGFMNAEAYDLNLPLQTFIVE